MEPRLRTNKHCIAAAIAMRLSRRSGRCSPPACFRFHPAFTMNRVHLHPFVPPAATQHRNRIRHPGHGKRGFCYGERQRQLLAYDGVDPGIQCRGDYRGIHQLDPTPLARKGAGRPTDLCRKRRGAAPFRYPGANARLVAQARNSPDATQYLRAVQRQNGNRYLSKHSGQRLDGRYFTCLRRKWKTERIAPLKSRCRKLHRSGDQCLPGNPTLSPYPVLCLLRQIISHFYV